MLRKERFAETRCSHRSPVLRKVDEYVKIEVPPVKFPSGNATPPERQTRGCLLGNEFKSIVINVRGAKWGEQVYVGKQAVGVEIPLWKPNEDARFYPKPHILVEMATDPDSGKSSTKIETDNPQQVVFFSSVIEPDANTDAWQAVPERRLCRFSDPAAAADSHALRWEHG